VSTSPVYVILGATGGIGSELSRRLARDGARLVLAARGEERLQELADELDALAVPTDATKTDQVDALFEQAKERFERVDGAVNAVGSIFLRPVHRTKDEDFDEHVLLNLGTAFRVTRAATRAMMKTGGRIVLLSTGAASIGLANHETIAAAKAGVEGLARATAATYANRGITINVVSPGLVDTPLAERLTASDKAVEASLALHAVKRLGQPTDIARAIAFLLHPDSEWITGQVLAVDGGLSRVKTPA
jgi:3-oxoacyl-[acyl-carrier protein] reductase